MKRTFDIVFASISIILISPILIITSLILLFTGEGKVLYFQERIGFENKKFNIIKFVTMVKNSPNIGTGSITLKNDPRVLPVGKFLRKSKINEFPQFFNVLFGDMSIVGPRPQMEVDFKKFPKKDRNKIYKSKPGITGIGSIIFRDEESLISNYKGDKHKFYKDYIAPYKTKVEIWYLNNSSIITDIKIILLTVIIIIYNHPKIIKYFFNDLPKSNI